MCFNPDGSIVCTTSTTPVGPASEVTPSDVDTAMRNAASGWDITVVLGVGLIAAALAAAASLRGIRGTSTPFSLPIALALLKLPTGAMTAILGLILMRGEFIPGLSALDTSGQIISWAVLLGYSQQLLTRFVDQRAQTVLDNVGRTAPDRSQPDAPGETVPAPT
jgi:hypothetical protein